MRTIRLFAVFCLQIIGTYGSNVEPCPAEWISYQKETPFMCVSYRNYRVYTVLEAQEECEKNDTNIMKIQTGEKASFFKEILDRSSYDEERVWIGLVMSGDDMVWLDKDENVTAKDMPRFLRNAFVYLNRRSISHYYRNGMIQYRYGRVQQSEYNDADFICEKEAKCKDGWFGAGCTKECHCYNQDCAPIQSDMTCSYGCQIGWMGDDCSQPKERADVDYNCISTSETRYADLRIYTKGVYYQDIHALDDSGQYIPWCNSTIIDNTTHLQIVNFRLYPDDDALLAMSDGRCAGKRERDGSFKWHIKLQEFQGIQSRDDQKFNIQCDFSRGDGLSVSSSTVVKRTRIYAQSLKKSQEFVKLKVVHAATQKILKRVEIGKPVVLKIDYRITEDNYATGLRPYNCEVMSSDETSKVLFLDSNSCPVEGRPISGFYRNGTKSLITKPFALFTIHGAISIEFHCSYILCFGEPPCSSECQADEPVNKGNVIRHKRSTRAVVHVTRND